MALNEANRRTIERLVREKEQAERERDELRRQIAERIYRFDTTMKVKLVGEVLGPTINSQWTCVEGTGYLTFYDPLNGEVEFRLTAKPTRSASEVKNA